MLSLAQAGDIDLDARAATYRSHPLLQTQPHRPHPDDVQDQAPSDAIIADPTRSWTPEEALAHATGPLTDPGHAPQNYSNSNYLLLGMLIETVTGLDYADDVHRDVLAGGNSRFAIQDTGAHSPLMAAPELTGTGKPPHHRNTLAFGRLHRPAPSQSGISAATTLVVVIENPILTSFSPRRFARHPAREQPATHRIDAEVT